MVSKRAFFAHGVLFASIGVIVLALGCAPEEESVVGKKRWARRVVPFEKTWRLETESGGPGKEHANEHQE